MAKNKTIYTCQNCAAQSPRWMGRCLECQQWNSFVEETQVDKPAPASRAAGLTQFREENSGPRKILEIGSDPGKRLPTRFQEFDRVLGGGIVDGALILIGGDPGIGKSTILMQGLHTNPKSGATPILYVSGEESASQIKLRSVRLGIPPESDFFIFAENEIEQILSAVEKIKPKILIIDSIQTIFSSSVQSAPGSVSQVRECTGRLMGLAKNLNIATFVVGHVTKEGSIAGPKVLEHIVDTVLYFEGSNNHSYRILRAVKNRFGSTNEIGVFEMSVDGLKEVSNPSELFLQDRTSNVPGTIVVAAVEGSRPVLVEIQALVSTSSLATPRRTALGYDHNKVALLLAVIEKRLGMQLYGHDVFVNVVGGIKLEEPATDLGVALALISSFRNRPIDPKLLVCGEVGLTGEVRRISNLDLRLAEAEKLGFTKAIVPRASYESLTRGPGAPKKSKVSVLGVQQLAEAVDALFE